MMDHAHLQYSLDDAKCDMLKKLNVLTDLECPTFADVQAMGIYSKAVKDLQEAQHIAEEMGEDDMPTEMMANGHHAAQVK